tara:strand:+ start:265 stop:372 length:108 start_codon:yes stop_codon:yes gene_type:complete
MKEMKRMKRKEHKKENAIEDNGKLERTKIEAENNE